MARAYALRTTDVTAAHLGWVLTDELLDRDGRRLVRKGAILDSAVLARLAEAQPGEVHLIELDADDLHEDAAGLRIARAVAGAGIRIANPQQSRYDLIAEHKGLPRVDADLLRAVNRVGDVTVYTMLDRQPVDAGTVLASVKITPIAIVEARVVAVERLCRAAAQPLLMIQPFQPKRVAVVTTEDLGPQARARFQAAIERKLRWLGSELTDLRVVGPTADAVAATFRDFLAADNDIVLAAGGNTIDPLDPIELALDLIGAPIVHRGAPTRGSMFWLAQAGAVPIVNLASSRMYIGGAVGDVILPLLLSSTGQQITPDDIIEIGYGGLPGSAIALRFPPYDAEPSDET